MHACVGVFVDKRGCVYRCAVFVCVCMVYTRHATYTLYVGIGMSTDDSSMSGLLKRQVLSSRNRLLPS